MYIRIKTILLFTLRNVPVISMNSPIGGSIISISAFLRTIRQRAHVTHFKSLSV